MNLLKEVRYEDFKMFLTLEKITEIKKSNQILLEKLLDISKGKKVNYIRNYLTLIISVL